MTWQPIATAPRDGSWVILGAPSAEPETGSWAVDDVWIKGWYCGGGRSDSYGPSFIPTHWQALPAPPQADADSDAVFLCTMEHHAKYGMPVTAEDVARLRRLADWADAAPPAAWNGTLDRHETRRAVEAARKRGGNG